MKLDDKRILIISGHYGSGKTNIAVEFSLSLKEKYPNVALADIDIVNPYFRSVNSAKVLSDAGVRLITSKYANTNLDAPAIPQEIYAVIDDKSLRAVIDVGGDDRGAVALGRLSDKIIEENNYEMLMVVNMYRPLTRTAADTLEIMREIEAACKIRFTGIINNSNLGADTTAQDVLKSVPYAEELTRLTGVEVKMTTVYKDIYISLNNKIAGLFPLGIRQKAI